MRRVDGYLSRRAQAAWAGALVYCDMETGQWALERPDLETVGLGDSFGAARAALLALVNAEPKESI